MAQYKRKNIQDNAIGADQIALDNNEFLKAENFAGNGFVNILKVNADDVVEFPVIPLMPGVDATEPNQLIRLAQLEVEVSALETADANNLQAAKDYTDAEIAAIPPVDLSAYATEQYVDDAIAAIPGVDLSAYETIVNVDSKDAATLAASNLYTDNAIAAIPPVDLTGYATEQYVDDAIAAIPSIDLSNYYNKTEVDSKDADTLAAANLYTDNAIAAIPPVDLSVIQGEVDQLQIDVDAVEVVAAQAQLEVDAVELRVGTLEADMTQAQSDIVSLDGRVDTLEGLVMNIHVHTGNLNASPYKIYLLSGVSLVKLPSPGINKTVTIKKTGSDLVTLEPHNTEQIEGAAANYLLTSTRQSATLVSDGTDWFII